MKGSTKSQVLNQNPEQYQNKYHIPSARLKHWNYAWHASHFVTICTQNRICYFGDIINGEMHLSEIGKIVKSEWMRSPHIRPVMNLALGVCVVMPNHFHGIIFIDKNKYNQRDTDMEPKMDYKNRFGPQSKNLASVIRGFKSAVTIQV